MNKKVVGALGLGAVALVGGTFAYFTQTSTIDNPFNTANYSTIVTEDFKPEDGEKWEPGSEVNKDLYVDNTGDRDVVVRVKFEDIWSRDGQEFIRLDNKVSVAAPSQLNINDGETNRKNAAGEVEAEDGSVVKKNYITGWENDWYYNAEDGYYYYKHNLKPGTSTGKFLDSVQLVPDTDMGNFMTQFYWSTADEKPALSKVESEMLAKGWQKMGEAQPARGAIATPNNAEYPDLKYTAAVTAPVEGQLGYSQANYVLRITIESVQATDQAIAGAFGGIEAVEANLIGNVDWNLSAEELKDRPTTMLP